MLVSVCFFLSFFLSIDHLTARSLSVSVSFSHLLLSLHSIYTATVNDSGEW